jgi:hypothetical protein
MHQTLLGRQKGRKTRIGQIIVPANASRIYRKEDNRETKPKLLSVALNAWTKQPQSKMKVAPEQAVLNALSKSNSCDAPK